LQGITVYKAKKIVIEWSVRVDGCRVCGTVESGRVKISHDSSMLSIFLTEDDLASSCPPLELGEELAKFLGIHDSERALVLQQILTRSDHTEILDLLERRGVNVPFPGLHSGKIRHISNSQLQMFLD
jgi:hypothetical protein